MGLKAGSEAKLYFCAAGIGGVPSWTEMPRARDASLTLSKKEADASHRGAGKWVITKGHLKDAQIEFEYIWDTSDAAFAALRASFVNGTLLGIACMDGDIDDALSEGLWADCEVMKFDRKEPLDGNVVASVTLKPTYSDNPPVWKVV